MAAALRISSMAAAWAALAGFGHFILAILGATNQFSAIALELAAITAAWFLFHKIQIPTGVRNRFQWEWILAILFAAASLLILPMVWSGLNILPHGDWDAWSIWNLRARMIEGGQWRHAISPEFSNHPDYPLLTSSLIANLWTASQSQSTLIPIVVSFFFFALTAISLVASVAMLCGRSAGWLAGLTLAASAGYAAQAVTQYADVPLSLYILLALIWLALDQPIIAGLFASSAAWTKNEGIAFAIIFLIAGSFAINRTRLWVGAAPGLAFVGFFRLILAHSNTVTVSLSAGNLLDASRYFTILAGLAKEIANIGLGWKHPLLLLAVLAIILGTHRSRTSTIFTLIIGAQLAMYLAIYALAKVDLDWLISTSLSRLIAQVWPSILLTLFLCLNPLPGPEPVPARKKT